MEKKCTIILSKEQIEKVLKGEIVGTSVECENDKEILIVADVVLDTKIWQ